MKFFLTITFSLFIQFLSSQPFISKGKIRYEVNINNHKSIAGEGSFADLLKEHMPPNSLYYYDLYFNHDKSLYKFDHLDEATKFTWNSEGREDNVWYNDLASNTFVQQRFVFDGLFLISDTLADIKWKLIPNDFREIAGFTCRKAVAKIFDSVYVFAYYSDEILNSGGPMSLHGLPGMILGVTIPRMYTSWIAKKVEVIEINNNLIEPPKKGKKRTEQELKKDVAEVSKHWGSWAQQAMWNIFL